MPRKRYTIEDMLAAAGVHIPIKKSYTLADVLAQKRHLTGKLGDCHIYDAQPPKAVEWLNKTLNPHNMAWAQRPGGWGKIVILDNDKPLPQNWETLCEKTWQRIPERCYDNEN